MLRGKNLALLLLPALFAGSALAQQSYVGRFDIYNGFAYFDSPDIHLNERGYHLQLGFNPKTWYALGFDYSVVTGTLTLTRISSSRHCALPSPHSSLRWFSPGSSLLATASRFR